jgi:hypothetical protein
LNINLVKLAKDKLINFFINEVRIGEPKEKKGLIKMILEHNNVSYEISSDRAKKGDLVLYTLKKEYKILKVTESFGMTVNFENEDNGIFHSDYILLKPLKR